MCWLKEEFCEIASQCEIYSYCAAKRLDVGHNRMKSRLESTATKARQIAKK